MWLWAVIRSQPFSPAETCIEVIVSPRPFSGDRHGAAEGKPGPSLLSSPNAYQLFPGKEPQGPRRKLLQKFPQAIAAQNPAQALLGRQQSPTGTEHSPCELQERAENTLWSQSFSQAELARGREGGRMLYQQYSQVFNQGLGAVQGSCILSIS